MDHWGIWDWTKFICCNRPLEITSDVNSLKQRSFYDSDIGYTAQEIHEQHQRLHHLVQQQLQQQQQQSSHHRSEDDTGINDEGETDAGNDSCLHDAQRRSVIGYNISNNSKNLYEDTYRHSSTLLGLNPHNDYERLKINGRNSDIDCNPPGRSHLSNSNFDNNCKNNNSRNNDSNLRTSNKLLDITNHQYYPHLITMDGLRNQLVRRKSGTGSTNNAIRPPTVERCDQLQVTLRGWLYRLEGGAIKQWKRRWFVLGDYCLFYYKDSHEEKCHGSVLLPSYRVSICKPNEDGITRKFSFKLEHQNMKTYFLAADSKESMEQWMTALNLASIMQLNYGSNNANMNSINRRDLSSGQPSMTGSLGYGPDGHNQSEGHDVTDSRLMMMTGASINNGKGYPTRCLTGKTSGGGDEEEDSGFNSYVPRRPPMPNSINNSSTESSGYLPAGAKYPGSFNCTGLSPISYHSSSYLAGHSGGQPLVYPPTHQKRSHYANAPPKPRRQQLDESGVLNCSDLYPVTNEFGAIPPGSHYNNQYYGPGNGPAPDLIAHNNSSSSNAVNNSSVCNSSSNIDQNNSVSSNAVSDLSNKQNNSNTAVNSNSYLQGPPYNSEYPQNDGINMQFTLSSPMSPNANANQHYSIPPPSQFTVSNNQMSGYHPHHHHHIQQQIQSQQQQHHLQQQQPQQQQSQQQQQTSTGQHTRSRLPPRPHSADFLDREAQDEDEMAEIENCYQHGNNINANANNNGSTSIQNPNGNHQYYQQQTSSVHMNSSDVDQSNNNGIVSGSKSNQTIQPPKILPIRPKSSLERYDPYYYTNHVEYGTSNGSINQQTQQLTSPPPRPWSDYLQQQAARQNSSQQQQQQQQLPTTANNVTQSSNSRPKGINFPPSNFDTSPRGQQDRDVSLLRLLEWKQKMLSGPLNKRNSSTTSNINNMTPNMKGAVKSPSHHHLNHSHHLNNSFGSEMTFTDVPMRPPLPKEYRNKIGLPDSLSQAEGVQGLMGDMRSHEEPIFSRERSKSIGSSFPVNDTYSSDDEGSQSGSYLDKKLRKRRSPRNRRSQDDLKNVSDSETTSKPPPPPPLPLGYNQHGYPYYCVNDNLNKLQRKLSRSVGTGLQNEQDIYNSKIFSSAGELLGKTNEELVLLLIQLRRNQSHLASTCESLRLQMESEEKMMEIEPQRREEHKSRYKELRESLLEVERQYENQFPVIDMVDNMVKLNHSGPGVTSNRHQQQHNRDHRDLSPSDQDNDFDFKRSKAASTSFLDRFPESQGVSSSSTSAVTHSGPPIVPQRGEQLKFTNYLSPPKKKEDEELAESAEQEKLIQYLKQDKDIIEKTLEGVRSSLTNLSLNGTSDGEESPSTSSNIDKMKQQQQMLEGELGRVRGLIVQSAKRLEQRAVENAWIEQDVLMARSQLDQILSSASTSTTMTTTNSSGSSNPDPVSLEAELANIDQAIDNLNAKRKEILENFKKQKNSDSTTTTTSTSTQSTALKPQPTAVNQTAVSSVKTNTSTSSGYGETDLESMESRDMTPFNYLKGYQQLTPENEIASTSGSNNLYENLDSNLVNYGYSHGSSNKINGRSEEYIDDEPGRQCQSDDSTNDSSTTRSEKIKPDQMVYNDNYDYGESSDGQQYTFQQPLLASNKTVRLVKRESERRRVTNKLSTYSTSVINYNNSNNNNTQYYQHFQQENDLSDFPVYTVNHSDGSTTIIDSGDNDEHFSEVDYDMVTSKRPSSLNLIEPTIKSDDRKEGR